MADMDETKTAENNPEEEMKNGKGKIILGTDSSGILSRRELEKINWDHDEWYKANKHRNDQFLELFKKDLINADLEEKTVLNHINDVCAFLDELGSRERFSMEDSIEHVSFYLGGEWIRGPMWAPPGDIKTIATSIEKFADTMKKNGYLEEIQVKRLKEGLEIYMPHWQYLCALYNSDEDWDAMAEESRFRL